LNVAISKYSLISGKSGGSNLIGRILDGGHNGANPESSFFGYL
jgi:hypothetical protein